MFQAMERKRARTVVQPVLAIVVHAGLISLALGGGPSAPIQPISNPLIPIPPIFVLRSAAGSSPAGGTPGPGLVSAPIDVPPDLPPLIPIVTGPISPGGTFDPRPFMAIDSLSGQQAPGIGVLTESDLTDPPRALHVPEPRYPEALRQAGIEGEVTVMYIVDAAGFVEPPSIRIVSSDYPAFAAAVVEAVGKAQFTPGKVRGRPVRVLVRQIIRFATR